MKFTDWLKPGIKVKRWVLFGMMGIIFIAFGLLEVVQHRFYNGYYKAF